eukprot:2303140-Lingulodinium_polyedra.AAC.1
MHWMSESRASFDMRVFTPRFEHQPCVLFILGAPRPDHVPNTWPVWSACPARVSIVVDAAVWRFFAFETRLGRVVF